MAIVKPRQGQRRVEMRVALLMARLSHGILLNAKHMQAHTKEFILPFHHVYVNALFRL